MGTMPEVTRGGGEVGFSKRKYKKIIKIHLLMLFIQPVFLQIRFSRKKPEPRPGFQLRISNPDRDLNYGSQIPVRVRAFLLKI